MAFAPEDSIKTISYHIWLKLSLWPWSQAAPDAGRAAGLEIGVRREESDAPKVQWRSITWSSAATEQLNRLDNSHTFSGF